MEVFRAVLEFVWAILQCLQGYLTGGVFLAAVLIWEQRSSRVIPWRKFRWGVIAFVIDYRVNEVTRD